MQYSNVAGKQKSNDVYRYPAELTSGKVRRLKFETSAVRYDQYSRYFPYAGVYRHHCLHYHSRS